MSSGTALSELRLLPLNQVAALKLKSAGEDIDPQQLPVFQLMNWGMKQGIAVTHRRTLIELHRLELQEPNVALAYLTTRVPGGLVSLERCLLRLPPRAAAEKLFDLLDMRLKSDPRNPYPV